MKKLFLLIAFLLFAPNAAALEPNYDINGFYVEADIQENGDMLVREQIIMNGAFNGYIRDLFYKGTYELYDASELELMKVCELNTSKIKNFNINTSDLKCFDEVGYASLGDSYLYQRNDKSDNISLTMFNYTEWGTKVFYIEYLLKDVVVIHNDVAELYWTFIGENFDDDIDDMRIKINLPSETTDFRAWAHGPLDGKVTKNGNKYIVVATTNLYANNLVDVRATFDKKIIPLGKKLSDRDALPTILKEEQQRADEANRQRETAKLIHDGIVFINVIWIFGAVLVALYTYRKYDKEYKSSFNLEYHREFPAEYGPEVVEFLMKKSVTPVSLSAMILNIISKRGFEIKEELGKRDKKEYTLIKKSGVEDKLTAEEAYVVEWLINDLGNGSEVSLKEIKDASSTEKSAKAFIEKYDKWVTLAKMNAEREEFYESNLGFKIKWSLYAVLGIGLFAMSMALTVESFVLFITLMVAITLLLYIISFTRRTQKGNDHFVKWKAFKKFLLDFGRFNEKELPEIVLWEKYLVYATVFGVADKVSDAMEIKLKSMGVDTTMPTYSHVYLNHYFAHNLVGTVTSARSMSVSKIAQTAASSGSGGGGGFSSGGGFGGGGIGGGGRGF